MKTPTQSLFILMAIMQVLPAYGLQAMPRDPDSESNASLPAYSVMDAVRDGYIEFVTLEEGVRVDFNVPPEQFKVSNAAEASKYMLCDLYSSMTADKLKDRQTYLSKVGPRRRV